MLFAYVYNEKEQYDYLCSELSAYVISVTKMHFVINASN